MIRGEGHFLVKSLTEYRISTTIRTIGFIIIIYVRMYYKLLIGMFRFNLALVPYK